jgi:hypothetical protein
MGTINGYCWDMYTITHEIQQQKAVVIAMNLPSPAICPQKEALKNPKAPSTMKRSVPKRMTGIMKCR